MGPVVHPFRDKSFRKAVSAVKDDLETCDLIIDNLHLIFLIILDVTPVCECLVIASSLCAKGVILGWVMFAGRISCFICAPVRLGSSYLCLIDVCCSVSL